MNVYRPSIAFQPDGNNVYAHLLTANEADRKYPRHEFRGQPIPLEQWTPLPVVRDYSIKGNLTKPLGDRPGIDARIDPMVLSRRALDVLLPHIGTLGQALPLAFDEAEYWLFNVTNVIDALDEAASELKYFEDGGLMRVVRYAFKPDAVRDQWLFKVPQQPGAFAFVTDRFIELVKSAGLTGFGFVHLWSKEVPVAAQASARSPV